MGAIYRNGFKYGDGNGVAQNPVLAVKLGNELRKPENGIVELPDDAITVSATGSGMNISTSEGRLNALTVYGKSEVVDGVIKSVGEGYAVVDLGTLNYTYDSTYNVFITRGINYATVDKMLCAKYEYVQNVQSWSQLQNKQFAAPYGIHTGFKNTDYTDPADFKTAMSGVLLCYKEATPTNNTIAIKTDNGSGVNGTMATFSTGTPLRGIPETNVRDVMVWDGSTGTVTKKCNGLKLTDVGWTKNTVTIQGVEYVYWSHAFSDIRKPTQASETPTWILSDKYKPIRSTAIVGAKSKIAIQPSGIVLISTEDPTDDTITPSGNFVYELATPTTQSLTSTENASIAALRTFTPQTHIQNNAGAEMTVEAYAGTENGKAVNAVNIELDSMINDFAATSTSTYSSEKIEDLLAEAVPKKIETPHTTTEIDCGVAEDVTFTGLTYFRSNNIWTDGTDVYYSYATDQYVLSPLTRTWTAKTWTGLTDFYGGNIWTDGENIYYSYNENQYVLDKSTSTWSAKTWNGLSSFGGSNTWTDGENIYYSGSSNHYVLDKSTSTWSTKTWSSAPNYFSGNRVWSDGENIYYSAGTSQHVLDKDTSTWKAKTWNGLTSFSGDYIWTDRKNIYYSKNQEQYVLNKLTSTWIAKTWINTSYLQGTNVWTDGETLYCTENNNVHKKLTPSLTYKSIRLR